MPFADGQTTIANLLCRVVVSLKHEPTEFKEQKFCMIKNNTALRIHAKKNIKINFD